MAKKNQLFTSLLLLFLLVGLPAVSYIYLRKGYEYRKAGIETQQDLGPMPDLTALPAVRGRLPATPRGAMTVVGWLDPTKPATAATYGRMLDSLYQQFENSANLYFTTIVKGDDAAATATAFAERYNLPEDEMLAFLSTNPTEFQETARAFALPRPELAGEQPLVALVDSSLTIVKHYDLRQRDQTLGLVQLISLIIPLEEKPDIVVKRDREL